MDLCSRSNVFGGSSVISLVFADGVSINIYKLSNRNSAMINSLNNAISSTGDGTSVTRLLDQKAHTSTIIGPPEP